MAGSRLFALLAEQSCGVRCGGGAPGECECEKCQVAVRPVMVVWLSFVGRQKCHARLVKDIFLWSQAWW